ncbi:MAG: hypothetical protein J6X03_00445 [Bacilli bacterium]|nr:hypothetical protein [Bacilli bacterium]
MKKFGFIRGLLAITTAMTLAACGGGTKKKAYVSFMIYGENAAVFEKVYDGQPATFSVDSINTNSDGTLTLKWAQEVRDESGQTVVNTLENAPVEAGTYQIHVSIGETSGYSAASTYHDFTISKAPIPQTWINFAADFPEVIHFTKTGSGRNVRRNAIASEVEAVKSKISVNDGQNAWTQDTDYTINVSIPNDTTANVVINSLRNQNYSNYTYQMTAEIAS